MNNKCPTCGASYNISPEHVGRTFTCQRCQSPLVVQAEGLALAGAPPGPQAPAAPQDAFTGLGASSPPAPGAPALPPAHSHPGGPNPIVDYLMFKSMSPPIVLIVLFWLGIAYILVSGLAQLVFSIQSMSSPFNLGPSAGVWGLFLSLLYLATAPVLWRILIETFAAVARMNSKS